jgi:hypothetical protein
MHSAPNNIVNPEPNPAGGSLGLGQLSNPDNFSTTRITISGLTPGVPYVLSFWWKCHTSEDPGELWVRILGTEFWNEDVQGEVSDNYGPNGVAFADIDVDRDEDFYVTDVSQPNQMFVNVSGAFYDGSQYPINATGHGQGVAFADADNDGVLDLYVANSGLANRLYRGLAGGLFTDVTSGPLGDTGAARGVAWGDYNSDGRVDLYIANYGGPNRLLRNDGALSFTDVTPAALAGADNTTGVAWGDYDSDGDPDLYVANYGQSNKLFRNDAGSFTDVTQGPLGGGSANSTGVCFGDVDTDGDLDLIVANDNNAPCRVLRNDGAGVFTDVTAGDLLTSRPVYGVVLLDGDNDGDLDLYLNIANQANRYYRNNGGALFTRLATDMDDPGNGRGVATADYDDDGDLDVYVCNLNGRGKLFRNDYRYGGNWLEVKLQGMLSNRAAIGARIKVTATGPTLPPGGLVQIREISGGSGYLSQSSLMAHFGLGEATQVSEIQIRWPSGLVETIGPTPVNLRATYREGGQGAVEEPEPPLGAGLVLNMPNPFRSRTRIVYDLERASPVRIVVFDVRGGPIRVLEDVAMKPPGRYELVWDAVDAVGRRVPAGVYFLRVGNPGSPRVVRMVVTN